MQVPAYSPPCSTPIFKRNPSASVILREKDHVEFFNVESDFSDVVDDKLEVIDGCVPRNDAFDHDCQNSEKFLTTLAKFRTQFLDESSEVLDAFEVFDGIAGRFCERFSARGLILNSLEEVFNGVSDLKRDFCKMLDLFDDFRCVDDTSPPMEIFFEVFDFIVFGDAIVGELCCFVEKSYCRILQVGQHCDSRLQWTEDRLELRAEQFLSLCLPSRCNGTQAVD